MLYSDNFMGRRFELLVLSLRYADSHSCSIVIMTFLQLNTVSIVNMILLLYASLVFFCVKDCLRTVVRIVRVGRVERKNIILCVTAKLLSSLNH